MFGYYLRIKMYIMAQVLLTFFSYLFGSMSALIVPFQPPLFYLRGNKIRIPQKWDDLTYLLHYRYHTNCF